MKRVLLTISLALLIFGLAAEDAMYGAFRVITKPKGADVTLYDADVYLSPTPTPVYPVLMDEYMDLVEGIPGRHIMLMITKKGYVPIRQEIFVPFTHEDESDALEAPSVFVFELEKDVKKAYHKVSIYYGYRYRNPRPPVHVYYHPWYPPVHYVWYHPYPHHPRPPRPPKPPRPPVVHSGEVTGTPSRPSLGTASGHRDKLNPPSSGGPKWEVKPSPPRKSKNSGAQIADKVKTTTRKQSVSSEKVEKIGTAKSKSKVERAEPKKNKTKTYENYSKNTNVTQNSDTVKKKDPDPEPQQKSKSKRK